DVRGSEAGVVPPPKPQKPAFSAFRLPLVEVSRTGSRTSLWGQLRAAAAGTSAAIERRVGRSWKRVAAVHRGAGGFFRWRGTLAKGAVVRLHAGAVVGAPL